MTLARAGSYVLTGGKVTGGTWTTDGAAGHGTDNDPVGGAYGVATGGAAKIGKGGAWLFGAGHGTASMGGAMTAVFTWDGPAGTEPPCVVVKETASADWGGNSGACDSGLSPQTTTPTTYGERKAAVVYTVIPNPPHVITRRCAPSGNASYTTDIPGYVAGGVERELRRRGHAGEHRVELRASQRGHVQLPCRARGGTSTFRRAGISLISINGDRVLLTLTW